MDRHDIRKKILSMLSAGIKNIAEEAKKVPGELASLIEQLYTSMKTVEGLKKNIDEATDKRNRLTLPVTEAFSAMKTVQSNLKKKWDKLNLESREKLLPMMRQLHDAADKSTIEGEYLYARYIQKEGEIKNLDKLADTVTYKQALKSLEKPRKILGQIEELRKKYYDEKMEQFTKAANKMVDDLGRVFLDGTKTVEKAARNLSEAEKSDAAFMKFLHAAGTDLAEANRILGQYKTEESSLSDSMRRVAYKLGDEISAILDGASSSIDMLDEANRDFENLISDLLNLFSQLSESLAESKNLLSKAESEIEVEAPEMATEEAVEEEMPFGMELLPVPAGLSADTISLKSGKGEKVDVAKLESDVKKILDDCSNFKLKLSYADSIMLGQKERQKENADFMRVLDERSAEDENIKAYNKALKEANNRIMDLNVQIVDMLKDLDMKEAEVEGKLKVFLRKTKEDPGIAHRMMEEISKEADPYLTFKKWLDEQENVPVEILDKFSGAFEKIVKSLDETQKAQDKSYVSIGVIKGLETPEPLKEEVHEEAKDVLLRQRKEREEREKERKLREKPEEKTKPEPKEKGKGKAPKTEKKTSLSVEADLESDLSQYQSALEGLENDMEAFSGELEEMVSNFSAFSEGLEVPEVPEPAAAEPPEEEEEGWLEKLVPAPMEPAMVPIPASVENPWILERQADTKQFPSEHDVAGGCWEVVEGEGKKHIVIKKDLKSKVKRKLNNLRKGAFNKGETVGIDFGDYIGTGVIGEYIGDGVYRVVSAGQTMKIPEKYLFRGSEDVWR